jgi:hypothetical protein
MSRVVRTLLISNKSATKALIDVQHPAVDRSAVYVSLRGRNLIVKNLRFTRIFSQNNAIQLDDFQALASLSNKDYSFSQDVPITAHLVLPFFIRKVRLLADIKLVVDSLGLTRISVDNLRRSIFLAAALPELEVVWVARSNKNLRDMIKINQQTDKLGVLVEVDEALLDSENIVMNLLECFTHLIATNVRTPERALELRTWSVSEIASQHITVLNIL